MHWKTVVAAALTLVTIGACTTSPTGRSQLMLISPDAAIVESRKAYLSTVSELDANDKLLDDPLVADRVATITGRLVTEAIAQNPRTRDWEWSVALIDDPDTVNAWAMAGGRMAVYTGLLEKLELTDAEFAHIMGHEIAHALANHTAERMSRAMATNLGIAVVGATSRSPEIATSGAALAAKLALQLPNSRTAESEADEIGMADVALEEGLRLAIDQLTHFAHWITPDHMRKRFDTHFYLAPAPGDHALVHDGNEAVDSQWIRPEEALAQAENGNLTMIFATRLNLERLAKSATVADAIDKARGDTVVTVMPSMRKTDTGRILTIPVEAGYGGPDFIVEHSALADNKKT